MSYGWCERSGQDEEDEICDLTNEQDEEDATSNLEALADLVLKEFPNALCEQELFIQICKMRCKARGSNNFWRTWTSSRSHA